MNMNGIPDPAGTHPVTLPNGDVHKGIVYLRSVFDHPNIVVGDYTYHSTFDVPEDAGQLCAALFPYLFPGAPECVRIGKFCQIAHGVRFITSSANHKMSGFSTYPFAIFDPERIAQYGASLDQRRDTVVGHDCWLGDGCTVLPGADIGHGVIVGAGAVVAGRVDDYSIVVGNPARVLRARFSTDHIKRLLAIRWWDWPIEAISQHEHLITGADIDALAEVAAGIA